METIKSIKEVNDHAVVDSEGRNRDMDGFVIETTGQRILLMIDNDQQCCESWGYFWCNDNPQDFVGANLLGVSIVDDALDTRSLENVSAVEDGQVMFVNLETSIGQLQFVAYNGHNGYYSHKALVKSEQLDHEEWL